MLKASELLSNKINSPEIKPIIKYLAWGENAITTPIFFDILMVFKY